MFTLTQLVTSVHHRGLSEVNTLAPNYVAWVRVRSVRSSARDVSQNQQFRRQTRRDDVNGRSSLDTAVRIVNEEQRSMAGEIVDSGAPARNRTSI